MNKQSIDSIRLDCNEVLKGKAEVLSPLKNDTLVISGGTGFVGTWISEMVATLNDEYGFKTNLVLVARNLERFKSTRPHLSTRKDIVLIKSDVRHGLEIPQETNWIIHAAANPSNRFHFSSPVETMQTIAGGTAAMLQSVERCSNFKMFLNLSSGLVYGPQPWELERIPENVSFGSPSGSVAAVYSDAKRYGETIGAAYRSQSRVPVVTARPFAFIGPYQDLDNPWAINNFIYDSMSGRPIRILGDGQTIRSYMYPSDLAFWLLRILTGGESGSYFNVGSPTGIKLADLANIISAQSTPRSEIIFQASSAQANKKSRFVPDVTQATEKLGLALTVPLESAIDKTIKWNRFATVGN